MEIDYCISAKFPFTSCYDMQERRTKMSTHAVNYKSGELERSVIYLINNWFSTLCKDLLQVIYRHKPPFQFTLSRQRVAGKLLLVKAKTRSIFKKKKNGKPNLNWTAGFSGLEVDALKQGREHVTVSGAMEIVFLLSELRHLISDIALIPDYIIILLRVCGEEASLA